jgi:hypothetical protein
MLLFLKFRDVVLNYRDINKLLRRQVTLLCVALFFSAFFNTVKAEESIKIYEQYTNINNFLANTYLGTTNIEVKENKKGLPELFVTNYKPFSVSVEFYGHEGEFIKRMIATPNSDTSFNEALTLVTNPLTYDYKNILSSDFLGATLGSGFTSENLPLTGHVRIKVGNKRAMATTAIAALMTTIELTVDGLALANGKSAPSGIKEYIKYTFFYDAIRNPVFMDSVVTKIVNYQETNDKNIKFLMNEIKDDYAKYLEGKWRELLNKYLYVLLNFEPGSKAVIERAAARSLTTLKALNFLNKLGTLAGQLSSITADLSREEEVVIGFFAFQNGFVESELTPTLFAWDGFSNASKKANYLANNKLYSVLDIDNTEKSDISTISFLNILKEIYERLGGNKSSSFTSFIEYELADIKSQLFVEGTTNLKDTLLYKDALLITGVIYEKLYPITYTKFKISPLNLPTNVTHQRNIYFLKNYHSSIDDSLYRKHLRHVYTLSWPTPLRKLSQLELTLNKFQAIDILYDLYKNRTARFINETESRT